MLNTIDNISMIPYIFFIARRNYSVIIYVYNKE